MDDRQARDARAVELMTRWTLVMLQNAECGRVPVKSLERFVDPSVIAALGPVAPPDARRRNVRPRVGGLRIQFDHDELAHVACVAGRPDGQLAGYVLEFRRDPDTRRWCVTEMSRAEERRLVDPSERRHTLAAQERGRQLPADLTGLIASTERTREDAAAAMERAQARAQALRDELARMNGGKSTWRIRKRIDLREQERVARVEPPDGNAPSPTSTGSSASSGTSRNSERSAVSLWKAIP